MFDRDYKIGDYARFKQRAHDVGEIVKIVDAYSGKKVFGSVYEGNIYTITYQDGEQAGKNLVHIHYWWLEKLTPLEHLIAATDEL